MFDKSQIPNPQARKFWLLGIGLLVVIWNLVIGCWSLFYLFAQEKKEEPIIVNGDTVEYSTEVKEVTASGNVSVTYKDTELTCQKLSVNTETKDGVAEGNARLEDKKGIIEGSKIMYNFQNKTGTILDSKFRSTPYFGKAERVEKVSDSEFIAWRGYMSTCNYDNPHYKMKSKKIDFFPHDKVRVKETSFYVKRVPLLYLPQYTHSLKDPLMHVQLMPGKKKDWGAYLLTAWRYSLTENIKGRIYLDYREKLGIAEGFGLNYLTGHFGKGDLKYYYTQERPRNSREGEPGEFQRYLIRWRHKWDIDQQTNVTSEYYKIVDSKRMLLGTEHNILKDYFFREYEKDSQPLSYVLLHRAFSSSSMDFIIQKRTNRWYTQLEKLPEIKYSLPSLKIGTTPFYLENNIQAANFNYKYAVPSPSTSDINMNRFDMSNKFSLPLKVAFIQLTPFVKNQETFYDKDVNGSHIAPRTIFYAGADASTKFYRMFNVKSNFLGLDINGLRHIFTPMVKYSYNHDPTIPSSKLKQIDTIDAIGRSNAASLEISNKLQTKRKGQTVDFADFRISSAYTFYTVDPLSNVKSGGSFSDVLFDLKLIPYAWMRMDADATYSPEHDYFSTINCDINFALGKERSLGIGQRYQRGGGKELTTQFNWRLTPKWNFRIYERYQFGEVRKKGLKEQEYALSRDLHCWVVDFTYNIDKEDGHTIWIIFRLKAFPEMEFGFNQSYRAPKSGTQSNP